MVVRVNVISWIVCFPSQEIIRVLGRIELPQSPRYARVMVEVNINIKLGEYLLDDDQLAAFSNLL